MKRGLKELLIDDYLDLDENLDEENVDDANPSVSFSRKGDFHSSMIDRDKTIGFYLRQILKSRIYEYSMALVVVLSSITLGLSLETDENYLNDQSRQAMIYAFDEVLMSILCLEFIFKLYLESRNFFFKWTNIFDLMIVLFGVTEIVWALISERHHSTITKFLKGFRLLQLIRFYRIIQLSEGLQVLTKSLIKTVLTYSFSVSILVFLSIYVIAVLGQMLYGESEQRFVENEQHSSFSRI